MNLPDAFTKLSLPEGLGNLTLNELLNFPETEVVKKGNKISIRRSTESGVTTLEHISYDSGYQETSVSRAPAKDYKKEYADDIRRMKNEGMRQKDIAFRLGISEAYISQILRGSR